MNGKKAIICSAILIAIVVILIVLKQNGILHDAKVWFDELLEPLKGGAS